MTILQFEQFNLDLTDKNVKIQPLTLPICALALHRNNRARCRPGRYVGNGRSGPASILEIEFNTQELASFH